MRELTDHKVNPANDRLKILVVDAPGAGGANHHYEISGFDAQTAVHIQFQNGPINEAGVNGVTQEVLLAIVADRLRSFQAGPYSCKENGAVLEGAVLEYVERAMDQLFQRTKARMARGVEGTHAI